MVAAWGNIVSIFSNEVIILMDSVALSALWFLLGLVRRTYFVASLLFRRDSPYPRAVAFTSHLILLPMMFAYEHFISCSYS